MLIVVKVNHIRQTSYIKQIFVFVKTRRYHMNNFENRLSKIMAAVNGQPQHCPFAGPQCIDTLAILEPLSKDELVEFGRLSMGCGLLPLDDPDMTGEDMYEFMLLVMNELHRMKEE
jgi:hypothetical protein